MRRASNLRLLSASLVACVLVACEPDSGDSPVGPGGPPAVARTADEDSLAWSLRPWNSAVPYGTMTDARDGHRYRTVTIGSQTWMAENLAWDTANAKESWCWDGKPEYCRAYGRYYTEAVVLAGQTPSDAVPSGVRGICPQGWHLPSKEEWKILMRATGDTIHPAPALRARDAGWADGDSIVPATDLLGFRALPVAYRSSMTGVFDTTHFSRYGGSAEFRTSSARGSFNDGVYTYLYASDEGLGFSSLGGNGNGLSVRCLRD